jgi:hypothetical protein
MTPFGKPECRRRSRSGKACPKVKLSPSVRQEFEAIGDVFGLTVINGVRCPACPRDAKPEVGFLMTKAEIESLLAGDEDGLAAPYEEYRL